MIIKPIRGIRFSVDYYNIYKKDLITGADYSPQIGLYYGNAGSTSVLAPGITGVTTDPSYVARHRAVSAARHHPVRLHQRQFGRRATAWISQIDATVNLTPSIRFHSNLDVTYVIELSQTIGGKIAAL